MTEEPDPHAAGAAGDASVVMKNEADAHFERYERYDALRGRGPARPTLLRALAAFAREGRERGTALDLGAGIGRDTLPMLRAGWQVTAVDMRAGALERIREEASNEGLGGLGLRTARLESFEPEGPVDLVNASFVLFLMSRADLAALIGRLERVLRSHGRLCGQFLGPRDSWAGQDWACVFEEDALRALLGGFAIEWLEEEESDALTSSGEPKHWHLFHVVARRR